MNNGFLLRWTLGCPRMPYVFSNNPHPALSREPQDRVAGVDGREESHWQEKAGGCQPWWVSFGSVGGTVTGDSLSFLSVEKTGTTLDKWLGHSCIVSTAKLLLGVSACEMPSMACSSHHVPRWMALKLLRIMAWILLVDFFRVGLWSEQEWEWPLQSQFSVWSLPGLSSQPDFPWSSDSVS